jgi:hypothetical protein
MMLILSCGLGLCTRAASQREVRCWVELDLGSLAVGWWGVVGWHWQQSRAGEC